MKTIIYLPGNSGRLNVGLGAELMRRCALIEGREQVGAFRELTSQEKITLIAEDLKNKSLAPGCVGHCQLNGRLPVSSRPKYAAGICRQGGDFVANHWRGV